MAENLKTSKFNDGTDIPFLTEEQWSNSIKPGIRSGLIIFAIGKKNTGLRLMFIEDSTITLLIFPIVSINYF